MVGSDGKTYIIVGEKQISGNGFGCPICRTVVTETFRAEDVYCDGFDNDDENIKKFIKECINMSN